MKKFVGICTVFILAAMLGGCATAAIQGASRAEDRVVIASHEEAAKAGDADAQHKMGSAYCCSIKGKMGVLDNQQATHWFCKAAAQNNADAEYELGRIYSGDLVRGMNAPAKLAALVTEQPTNRTIALMWFERATAHGNKDAADKAADLRKDMKPAEILAAAKSQLNPQSQPCEWNDVYPDRRI